MLNLLLMFFFLISKPNACDQMLWQHVYHPQRLKVLAQCVQVTGTIVDATAGKRQDGVRHEKDGDTHGWLKVNDPHLLASGNDTNEGGNLVFEVVCAFKTTQADAIPACKGYKNIVKIPPIGSQVKMTGSLVQDTNHAHWNEIHPVTSIEIIK